MGRGRSGFVAEWYGELSFGRLGVATWVWIVMVRWGWNRLGRFGVEWKVLDGTGNVSLGGVRYVLVWLGMDRQVWLGR